MNDDIEKWARDYLDEYYRNNKVRIISHFIPVNQPLLNKYGLIMSKNYNQQREELSPEGKRLWDEMMGVALEDKEFTKTVNDIAARKKSKEDKQVQVIESEEIQRMRLELRKLQQNSRIVVKECEELQQTFTKKEQYFKANECRVAVMCHNNFIERIDRILKGTTAFEGKVNDKLTQDLSGSNELSEIFII